MKESMNKRRFLIAAFGGWNDACQAATDAIKLLLDSYASKEIDHICCDSYYDYQCSRPMMCTVNGRKRIIWPETTFYEITIDENTAIYAEMGPEPNFHWSDFCHRSLRIADECEITGVITLGSMFADCTHTRALPVNYSEGDDDDAGEDSYSGPVGIPTVLNYMAAEDGFEAGSLWVSIPQYMNADSCSAGTLRLLEELSAIVGIPLEEGDLPSRAERWHAKAEMLMRCNDDLADYVHHVERMMDEQKTDDSDLASTPHGQQLIQETEDFLRSFDHPAAPEM